MTKPKEVIVYGKEYFAWPYEEQTKIKHKVISYYMTIWLSKLGKYNDTFFMDCHGGCGAYIDLSTNTVGYGSSIIVDKIATEINANRSHKNYICVCENNKKNYENLLKVWEDQSCSNLCRIRLDNFNNVIKEKSINNYYSTHPSLFLIDPFGYDLVMENMKNLMNHKGSEIIINFMYDHLNRFLSVANLDAQRDDFFGSHEWINAIGLSGRERENYLVELYKRKLKETTKAKFVFAYRLCFPDRNQTYYYLIHATNDIQGIVYMKNSFAGVNNGRLEYLGKYQNALTLFDLDNYKNEDIARNVLKKYTGKTIQFINLLEEIIEDIPFLEKDLSDAISMLEKEKKVNVRRVSSKRGRYRDKDQITFGEII